MFLRHPSPFLDFFLESQYEKNVPVGMDLLRSNLRCAILVCGTSKHKCFMPKCKNQKKYKSCLTCYIHHLLSPDIKYVRLKLKIKF